MAGSKTQLVSPAAALPGRSTPIPTAERHAVLGTALKAPLSTSQQEALFGCGCFWGAERTFWHKAAIGGAVGAVVGALFYAGVVAMVGFWLLQGNVVTPLAQWGSFALAYLPLVLLEPVLTVALVQVIKQAPKAAWLRQWTVVEALQVGS